MSVYKLVLTEKKEIHILPGYLTKINDLYNYLKYNIKNCPENFELKYKDKDNDWINLSTD